MKTRIYLFTGFLDSGKSTFINDTVVHTDFCQNEKSVLVVSELGDIEFNQEEVESVNCDIVYISKEEDINYEFFDFLYNKYEPTQIIMEVNGMYNVDQIVDCSKPEGMEVVQVLTTIDASTFNLYFQNMRSLIYQHVKYSDLLIFNRINDSIKKSFLRNNIKAINPKCQVVYELEDGTIAQFNGDELPFDTTSDTLNILDHDFGLFCMDTMEHAQRYEGKTITLRAKFIGRDKELEDGFIIGRQAIVCCEDDTALMGIICEHPLGKKLIPEEWVEVTGVVELAYDPKSDCDVCILVCHDLKVIPALENPYVSFD